MSTRPDYRKGKVDDLAHGAANFLSELVKESREALPTCLNCAYFDEPNAFCTQYKGTPPPRVIVYACAGYADKDQVPF